MKINDNEKQPMTINDARSANDNRMTINDSEAK